MVETVEERNNRKNVAGTFHRAGIQELKVRKVLMTLKKNFSQLVKGNTDDVGLINTYKIKN